MISARGAAQAMGTVLFVVLAGGVYLICAVVGVFVVGAAVFFVFPDPCLPMCVAVETRGGGMERVGTVGVLAASSAAYLGALVPMRSRWRRVSALAVPLLAAVAITPTAVAGLLAVDALTADSEVVSCSC